MIEWADKFNAFNGMKILVHRDYWRPIVSGNIPPPLFVSIDPTNICNLSCTFCNSSRVIGQKSMSFDYIRKLVSFLGDWKVRAACVGGGGEPLCNPYTIDLIHGLTGSGIKVGVVTNGTLLGKCSGLDCEWIGVSVNAGSPSEFDSMQRIRGRGHFDRIISNIQAFKRVNKRPELTYKVLVTDKNFSTIFSTIALAREIGCDNVHIRPVGGTWFDLRGAVLSIDVARSVFEQVKRARKEFEDEDFRIYNVFSSRFNPDFSTKKSFEKCFGTFVTCVFTPDENVSLCCDQRGNDSFILCKMSDLMTIWGSDKHKNFVRSINPSHCPRCSLSHVNVMFENIIVSDNMLCDFI